MLAKPRQRLPRVDFSRATSLVGVWARSTISSPPMLCCDGCRITHTLFPSLVCAFGRRMPRGPDAGQSPRAVPYRHGTGRGAWPPGDSKLATAGAAKAQTAPSRIVGPGLPRPAARSNSGRRYVPRNRRPAVDRRVDQTPKGRKYASYCKASFARARNVADCLRRMRFA